MVSYVQEVDVYHNGEFINQIFGPLDITREEAIELTIANGWDPKDVDEWEIIFR